MRRGGGAAGRGPRLLARLPVTERRPQAPPAPPALQPRQGYGHGSRPRAQGRGPGGLSKGCAGWAWSGLLCAVSGPNEYPAGCRDRNAGPGGAGRLKGGDVAQKCGGPACCVPAAALLRPIAPSPPSPRDHTPPPRRQQPTNPCSRVPPTRARPLDPQPAGSPASMAFCPTTGSHGFFATLLALLQVRRRWRGNLERRRRARPRGLARRLPAAVRPPSSAGAMRGQGCGVQPTQRGPTTPRRRPGAGAAAGAGMGPFPPTGWRAPETSAALPPLPTTDCPVDSHRSGGQRGALDLEGSLQVGPQVGAAAAQHFGCSDLQPCCA